MADSDSQSVDTKPFELERHATAIAAIAALASSASSLFMSDHRALGYTFAIISLLLLVVVAVMRSMDAGSSTGGHAKFLKPLMVLVAVIGLGLPALALWSYEHPLHRESVQPGAPSPTPPVEADSHDHYQTNGKNSPIITGGSGTINIGNSSEEPPRKRKDFR